MTMRKIDYFEEKIAKVMLFVVVLRDIHTAISDLMN